MFFLPTHIASLTGRRWFCVTFSTDISSRWDVKTKTKAKADFVHAQDCHIGKYDLSLSQISHRTNPIRVIESALAAHIGSIRLFCPVALTIKQNIVIY